MASLLKNIMSSSPKFSTKKLVDNTTTPPSILLSPPPLPTLHIHAILGMSNALAIETLLKATNLAGLPVEYSCSRTAFKDISSDEEKVLSHGNAAPWMVIDNDVTQFTLSGVANCVAFIRELHRIHNVPDEDLIKHGACVAPPELGPLAFPKILQELENHRELFLLSAFNTFSDFPEAFWNTRCLPHFAGQHGALLYKSLSDINQQKQSLLDAQNKYFQRLDNELNFSGKPFLTGNTFCVLDISFFFAVAVQIRAKAFNINTFPCLRCWYESIIDMPCIAACWPDHWSKHADDPSSPSDLSEVFDLFDETADDLALTPLQQAVKLLQTIRDNTADPETAARTRRVTSIEAISSSMSDVLTLLSDPRKVNVVDIHRMRDAVHEVRGNMDADAVLEQFDEDETQNRSMKKSRTVTSSDSFKRRMSVCATDTFPGIGSSWSFDVREIVQGNPLCTVVSVILDRTGFLETLPIPETKMSKFVEAVESKYCDIGGSLKMAGGRNSVALGNWASQAAVPYHNAYHAADVTNAIWILMSSLDGRSSSVNLKLTVNELFAGFVSAMFHDVGHEGINNSFLVNTSHELALRYNDQSPLENMHLAVAWQVSRSPGCEIFEAFPDEEYKLIRKLCIGIVLATDMSTHFDSLSALKSDVKNGSGVSAVTLLKTCMKCADLSHGSKPYETHEAWSMRITEEFYNQGDAEEKAGLKVLALFDRKFEDLLPKNQCGFLKYVVEPLYSTARSLLLEGLSAEIMGNIEANLAAWERIAKEKEQLATPTKEEEVGFEEGSDEEDDEKTKTIK
jgi:hypothetical protein